MKIKQITQIKDKNMKIEKIIEELQPQLKYEKWKKNKKKEGKYNGKFETTLILITSEENLLNKKHKIDTEIRTIHEYVPRQ